MGRPNWLLLAAVVLAGALALALGGLALARWRALDALPTLEPRVVLTVTPVPTVPPLTAVPATPSSSPSAAASVPTAVPVQDLSATVARALRGVVQVRVPDGLSTGFVWARENGRTLVVTAAHVVGRWSSVQVIAPDGTAHPATVLRRDGARDVALLEAPVLAGVDALPRGSSRTLPLGASLTVLGYALGDQLLGEPTVTRGVLSGRRTFEGTEYLQTDAAANPGASGGPLLDEQGAVVGMMVGTLAWAGQLPAQNLNFAVAIEEIAEVVTE
ncbi:MAG: serine protease [Thermomicrobium sp.]|nr:serine protease [Thermomicrobium sp.]MDW8060186.1 serine protease [Thermomicrobium sp.]